MSFHEMSVSKRKWKGANTCPRKNCFIKECGFIDMSGFVWQGQSSWWSFLQYHRNLGSMYKRGPSLWPSMIWCLGNLAPEQGSIGPRESRAKLKRASKLPPFLDTDRLEIPNNMNSEEMVVTITARPGSRLPLSPSNHSASGFWAWGLCGL